MNNDKISIIIPVYNAENFLQRLLSCIDNQLYKKLEIIFVNDESNDNSENMILSYIKNSDYECKYIKRINGGVAAARNTGLEVVSGTYISFIDSDDYIKPDFYEKMLRSIKYENADIAMCGVITCKDNTLVPLNCGNPELSFTTNQIGYARDFFLKKMLRTLFGTNFLKLINLKTLGLLKVLFTKIYMDQL